MGGGPSTSKGAKRVSVGGAKAVFVPALPQQQDGGVGSELRPAEQTLAASGAAADTPAAAAASVASSSSSSSSAAAAMAGPTGALPPGWQECTSRSTGEVYYCNVETGATQWDPPCLEALPQGWERCQSNDTGEIYYLNRLTGEVQFDVPTDTAVMDEALRGAERTAAQCRALCQNFEMLQSFEDLSDGAPIFMAAVEGSSEAIAAVCAADPASVARKHPYNGASPLHLAALYGHVQCVDELLSWGADPCAGDNSAQTPCHYAANQEDVLYALLSSSSARFAVDCEAEPNRESPLLLAALQGNVGACSCLIDYGADVDSLDREGTTALQVAAVSGHRKVIKLLLHYGASLKLRDALGRTALELATDAGHDKARKTLQHAERRRANEAGGGRMPTLQEEEEEEEEEDEGENGLYKADDIMDEAWVRRGPDQDGDSEHVHHSHVSTDCTFQVRALYDYASTEEGDLSFVVNTVIGVTSTEDPGGGWWSGVMQDESSGCIIAGIFPSNFVETIGENSNIGTGAGVVQTSTGSIEGTKEDVGGALSSLRAAEMDAIKSELQRWHERAISAEDELEKLRDNAGRQQQTNAAADAPIGEELAKLKAQSEQKYQSLQTIISQKDAELVRMQAQLQSRAELEEKGADAASLAAQRAEELAVTNEALKSTERENVYLQERLTKSQAGTEAMATATAQVQAQLEQCQKELALRQLEIERMKKSVEAAAGAEIVLKQMQAKVDVSNQALSKADATAAAQAARLKNLDVLYKKEWALRKKYYNALQDSKGNIRVYARVRPLLHFEKKRGDTSIVDTPDDSRVRVRTQTTNIDGQKGIGYKTFSYNTAFGVDTSQEEVFADAKDLVQSTIDGYNVCIFSYGQTGSGKTFTMYGNDAQPGVAPRTVEELWALIGRDRKERGFEFKVKVYMAELYNAQLHDLGREDRRTAGPKLFVRKDAKGMVFIQNITEIEVHNTEETNKVLHMGLERRHVTGTKMNAESSRSHLIFSVVIDTKNPQTGAASRGKISLVDMAGSERVKRSEVTGEAFKEAVEINKSLSALLDVIDSLSRQADNKADRGSVPYRNHLLTQLMSDSLGGNAKTLMFVNISPASSNEEETVGSLGYATRASLIKNHVKKQEDTAEVRRLKKIIERLSSEQSGRGGGAGGTPPPTRSGTPPPTRGAGQR